MPRPFATLLAAAVAAALVPGAARAQSGVLLRYAPPVGQSRTIAPSARRGSGSRARRPATRRNPR